MKRLLQVLALFTLFVSSAFAGGPNYVTTYSVVERVALASWVQTNASKKISIERSRRYVDQAYLHAFAKQLDPLIVLAMMKVESGFVETAKSYVGAKGLLQVWPKWHKDKLQGRDPYKPEVSIEVGTQILKDCLSKPKSAFRKAMVCYSGGARNYDKKVLASHRLLAAVVVSSNLAAVQQNELLAKQNTAVQYENLIAKLVEHDQQESIYQLNNLAQVDRKRQGLQRANKNI